MILAGCSAIVTGGAVRIGREIALALAQRGVNICLHYGTSATEAAETETKIRELGVQSVTVSADLTQPVQAARKIFETANNTLGEVQILINSAAIFEAGSLQSTDEENWNRHIAINLQSPFFLSQQLSGQMRSGKSGHIVNIVDWRGERPVPGHAAYTISKAGLIAQTKLLAQELGPNIRVNAIAPGPILPPPGESEHSFQDRAHKNPLRRTGNPQEICRAVMYLLESVFVTGEILHVTGGEELGVPGRNER
ncbi:SDR family oxidoreductase [Planctomicrobium sp. SH668]|uniref:SDR family oxidoreductase n=1 Tax=Planctomicrobium sp. SH668 TaxID=3448126 RepID=UPI003F5C733B